MWVARDTTTFRATGSLPDEITRAIRASRNLIVVASPDAAVASWVRQEIARWYEVPGASAPLIVLAAGSLVWDPLGGDFRPSPDYPLPPELGGRFSHEPLWVDLRWVRVEQSSPAPPNARFKRLPGVARLANGLRAYLGSSLHDARFQEPEVSGSHAINSTWTVSQYMVAELQSCGAAPDKKRIPTCSMDFW
jgi:hypothetical protein